MLWPEDIPDGPEYYTHKCWQWDGGLKPWAKQYDLPKIILHGQTERERREAIKQLQDETMRTKLVCRAQTIGDAYYLIHGICSQSLLCSLAADEKNSLGVRLLAIDCIREPEMLRIVADSDCKEVRSKAAERIVDMAKSPEQLKELANDDLLPLHNRTIAALMLGDSPEILDLYGTNIYQESDVARTIIDKAKRRLSKHRKTCSDE